MKIYINGSPHEFKESITITALIEHLGFTGKRIAVEVNHEIVPRSQHTQTFLHENDRLEIVHAIGGG